MVLKIKDEDGWTSIGDVEEVKYVGVYIRDRYCKKVLNGVIVGEKSDFEFARVSSADVIFHDCDKPCKLDGKTLYSFVIVHMPGKIVRHMFSGKAYLIDAGKTVDVYKIET